MYDTGYMIWECGPADLLALCCWPYAVTELELELELELKLELKLKLKLKLELKLELERGCERGDHVYVISNTYAKFQFTRTTQKSPCTHGKRYDVP